MENKTNYKITNKFVPDRRTPSEMDIDTLNLMCSQKTDGILKCVQVVMSSDIRTFTNGIPSIEMLKSIQGIMLTAAMEVLKREGKLEADKELSWNLNEEIKVKRVEPNYDKQTPTA